MSATPIRFAIVGTGSIARRHAQAIAAVPDAKLVAVWGRDEGRGRDFAAEHGADFVDCLETLAARDDVQAATIATPSGSHSQSCAPFLRAGKAVLCEKPLDVTLEKIDTLLALAQTHRAPLAAVLQLRFGAAAQALKKAVEQGRFGRLTHQPVFAAGAALSREIFVEAVALIANRQLRAPRRPVCCPDDQFVLVSSTTLAHAP